MSLYVIRNEKGHLILHQRKPGNYLKNRYARRYNTIQRAEEPIYNRGQRFRINEFPGSEMIPISTEKNEHIVPVELFIPAKDVELYQELWVTRQVTRQANRDLILHYKEKPTRMCESNEWKHDRLIGRIYLKKNAKKWTAWRGHCYVNRFVNSNLILFEDKEPTRVEIRLQIQIT